MQLVFNRRNWLAAAVAAVLSLTVGVVSAHEGREVGDYRINIGWIVEPAYEGLMNGVEVRVTRVTVSGGDDHGESMSMSEDDDAGDGMAMAEDHHGEPPAVEDLENTLQVDVVYVPTADVEDGESERGRVRNRSLHGCPVADDAGGVRVPRLRHYRGNAGRRDVRLEGRWRRLRRHPASGGAPIPGGAPFRP